MQNVKPKKTVLNLIDSTFKDAEQKADEMYEDPIEEDQVELTDICQNLAGVMDE